ncbi:NlpC/P60 family protein [Proteus mirabilis]
MSGNGGEEGENLEKENYGKAGFVDSDGEAKEGDRMIMHVKADAPNHAGVIMNGMLLHHRYGQLSRLGPYSDYWRDRTVKIVRRKEFV